MGRLGTTELIIIFVIVILLFGVGRIGKLGSEMGNGIREFREGLMSANDEDQSKEDKQIEENESLLEILMTKIRVKKILPESLLGISKTSLLSL